MIHLERSGNNLKDIVTQLGSYLEIYMGLTTRNDSRNVHGQRCASTAQEIIELFLLASLPPTRMS